MHDKLNNLLSAIDDYVTDDIAVEKIDELTLELISDDDFEKLSEELQDCVYTLDNHELNTLSNEEIVAIKNKMAILSGK